MKLALLISLLLCSRVCSFVVVKLPAKLPHSGIFVGSDLGIVSTDSPRVGPSLISSRTTGDGDGNSTNASPDEPNEEDVAVQWEFLRERAMAAMAAWQEEEVKFYPGCEDPTENEGRCRLTVEQTRRITYQGFNETRLQKHRVPPRHHRRYFEGKLILVTGASSGIGERLAINLAAAGAHLVLTGRNEKELYRVQRSCVAAWKWARYYTREKAFLEGWRPAEVAVVFPGVDLARESDVEVLAQVVEEEAAEYFRRPLSIIFNNAGISSRSEALETSTDVDRDVMDINFWAPVAITKAFLPGMLRRGTGHIVVVSGLHGLIGMPDRTSNVASKHALRGYFDALRAEIAADNIHITVVYPGHTATRLGERALMGDGSEAKQVGPARGVDADKVAMRILDAVARKKPEAVIGISYYIGILLRALWPSRLFATLAKRNTGE